jgi:UPF0271 protein
MEVIKMYRVDLNCDLGESFGSYTIGMDEEVIKYVTSVNIACGWHAGDPMVMEKTVSMAKKYRVEIGAHPGFLDLMGFGRRNIAVTPEEVNTYIKYQLGALMAFARAVGEKVQHVKPHGAMYNMAAKDSSLAMAIARAVFDVDPDIILVGLANSELVKAGQAIGLRVANEVFADRAYNADGTLVGRSQKGAVIDDVDTAIYRIIRTIKEGRVTAITGEDIEINAQTICVHGDNSKAVDFVKNIRIKLEEEGIEVTAMSNFIK